MNWNKIVASVLNRSECADAAIRDVLDYWEPDLFKRRPSPALLEGGILQPTDLDLSTFLFALKRRGAVINLPVYKARRAKVEREGEHVISAANRHGKVNGLTANKEAFSFSVRIFDMNVVVAGDEEKGTEDEVGAHRNYMVVDVEGLWYDGWKCIEFLPSAKENAFLADRSLWTDNKVVFQHFVHPNRWRSLYARPYLALKLAIDRLDQEAGHLRAECKRLAALAPPPKEWAKTSKTGEEKSIKVKAFEAELGCPFDGDFSKVEETKEAVAAATVRARELTYTRIPELRFMARSTELAYALHGLHTNPSDAGSSLPPWQEEKVKKTLWSRLDVDLFDVPVSLRVRTYEKTERVAA